MYNRLEMCVKEERRDKIDMKIKRLKCVLTRSKKYNRKQPTKKIQVREGALYKVILSLH